MQTTHMVVSVRDQLLANRRIPSSSLSARNPRHITKVISVRKGPMRLWCVPIDLYVPRPLPHCLAA